MARPPLPLGTPGQIKVIETTPKVWVARCRFRDHDGVTRRLKAHGPTQSAARNSLHDTIRDRQRGTRGAGSDVLTPSATFADAAELYLAKVLRRRADSTHAVYAFHLMNTILPALGALRLLRVPRDLAQPTPPPLRPGLAVPDRVREPEQDRRGLKFPATSLRRTRGTPEPPPDPARFTPAQARGAVAPASSSTAAMTWSVAAMSPEDGEAVMSEVSTQDKAQRASAGWSSWTSRPLSSCSAS